MTKEVTWLLEASCPPHSNEAGRRKVGDETNKTRQLVRRVGLGRHVLTGWAVQAPRLDGSQSSFGSRSVCVCIPSVTLGNSPQFHLCLCSVLSVFAWNRQLPVTVASMPSPLYMYANSRLFLIISSNIRVYICGMTCFASEIHTPFLAHPTRLMVSLHASTPIRGAL